MHYSSDSSGFVSLQDVIPEALPEIRYAGNNNFVGERIDGYEEPVALMTREAAEALSRVNRRLLREMMTRQGFLPIETEWWHFTLANEPYPETCFTFPVRQDQRGRTAR